MDAKLKKEKIFPFKKPLNVSRVLTVDTFHLLKIRSVLPELTADITYHVTFWVDFTKI